MKKNFVRTKNILALEMGIEMLKDCGAREARWMLATGRPGEGKTTTLYNLAQVCHLMPNLSIESTT